MSLANLSNIPTFAEPESFSYFSFSNNDQHRLVIDAISSQRGVDIPIFPLDPIPFFDFDSWLRLHQQNHNNINAVLGVAGVDLTSVDFRDQGEAANWCSLHEQEHLQWTQILGI